MADATRLLVTGAREYGDPDIILGALTGFSARHPGQRLILVHGRCDPRTSQGQPVPWREAEKLSTPSQMTLAGADWLADRTATRLGWGIESYPAEWKQHGKGAGPLRNTRMVASMPLECDAFFAGGRLNRGTLDCATKALVAGIATLCFCDKCPYPQLQPCDDHSLAPLLRAWGKVAEKTRVPDEQPEVKLW